MIATNVHDSQAADGLVQAGDVVMHGDSAYVGQSVRMFQRYVGRAHNQAAIEMLNLCNNLKCYETILRPNLHPLATAQTFPTPVCFPKAQLSKYPVFGSLL